MCNINSVKDYKYSILVKKIVVLKRLKKRRKKKWTGTTIYTCYFAVVQITFLFPLTASEIITWIVFPTTHSEIS